MLQTVLNKRTKTRRNSKKKEEQINKQQEGSKKSQTIQEKVYLSSVLEYLVGKIYFLLTYRSSRRSLGFHKPFIQVATVKEIGGGDYLLYKQFKTRGHHCNQDLLSITDNKAPITQF